MMKRTAACFAAMMLVMMAAMMSAHPVMATVADNATFTIKAGTPPAEPDSCVTCEDTTAKFDVALSKKDAQNTEDPAKHIKSQSFSVSAGDDSTITKVTGGDFKISDDKHSAKMDAQGGAVPGSVAITVNFSAAGDKTVSLGGSVTFDDDSTVAGSDKVTVTVTASPSVDKIQYKDPDLGYVDTPSFLMVMKGTKVDFKAIPNPADKTFPADHPEWSGTSGATGTGETTNVTFDTLSKSGRDYKTVVAKSCSNEVTINVVVYDLEPVFKPVDDFEGRSYTDFGIAEDITLSVVLRYDAPDGSSGSGGSISTSSTSGGSSSPPLNGSFAGENIGGLVWTAESGDNGLQDSGYGDGLASYVGADEEGEFSLCATVKSGPSKGKKKTKSGKIVAPSGDKLEKVPQSNIRHTYSKASVGFLANSFISPSNVSFANVEVREGTVVAKVSGTFERFSEEARVHEPSSTPNRIVRGMYQGKLVHVLLKTDEIVVSIKGPFGDGGGLEWPIPIEWRRKATTTKTAGQWKKFATAKEVCYVLADGYTVLEKGGSEAYDKEASDPTIDFLPWNGVD